MAEKNERAIKVVAENRKARFNYAIEDTLEAIVKTTMDAVGATGAALVLEDGNIAWPEGRPGKHVLRLPLRWKRRAIGELVCDRDTPFTDQERAARDGAVGWPGPPPGDSRVGWPSKDAAEDSARADNSAAVLPQRGWRRFFRVRAAA